jgi:CRP/FNR family transcriptional regulator
LGCKSASEKVAALLLMIARRVPPVACAACSVENRQGIIELPLSRSEMAEYLGLRLETVSRQLQRLETRSVIKRLERRRLAICDIHRLEQIAG